MKIVFKSGFWKDRQGGGMLILGLFALITFAMVGANMTSLAWAEANQAELRGAAMAALSSAGNLFLEAGTPDGDRKIAERVAAFVTGLLPGVTVDPDQVTVSHNSNTGITTVTVVAKHETPLSWMFAIRGGTSVTEVLHAAFTTERDEVAVALDVSPSMLEAFGADGERQKFRTLRTLMGTTARVMADRSRDRPGTFMVSVVPFAGAVNVAETGNAQGRGRTPGKEIYLKLLEGADHSSIDDLITEAKGKRDRGEGGHWVDIYNHYGVGEEKGPLQKRYLDRLLTSSDWDMRRTGEQAQVTVPPEAASIGTWATNDIDFWNGCVMARWGGQWDSTPPLMTGWRAGDWPASRTSAGWSQASPALPKTPLHLSDEPPDSGDPATLFTAYSWPDARVMGTADARLQLTMADLLDSVSSRWVRTAPFEQAKEFQGDNDWSLTDGGGFRFCPINAIVPLTEDSTVLVRAVNEWETVEPGPGGFRSTLPHLGVVWALRTLSPLWQTVWNTQDGQGSARPAAPCLANETGACVAGLRKTIILVTDGEPWILARLGALSDSRNRRDTNPRWGWNLPPCERNLGGGAIPEWVLGLPNYNQAAADTDEATFNQRFSGMVAGDGTFNATGADRFIDALIRAGDSLMDSPTRRAGLRNLVQSNLSPWDVFRGEDREVIDVLVDPENEFGFNGRPALPGRNYCHASSMYGPYGRINDTVYAGDDSYAVGGAAPFSASRLSVNPVNSQRDQLHSAIRDQLNEWLGEACAVAGARGVHIEAIFIGSEADGRRPGGPVAHLEACVDRAGGSPGVADVHVTPTAAALEAAFKEIMTVRARLVFR